MKTVKQDIDVNAFINTYPEAQAKALKLIVETVSQTLNETPSIWGRDIIGFGEITYSNTYVKNQPFFLIGIRAAKHHVTFYLNAYQTSLMEFAETHNIKHGKGCFHVKKAHERLDVVRQLVMLSERP